MRSTLDFVIHSLGPNDRVSLVAFTVGIDGEVKRTGLLNPHREASRKLLQEFVQNIGQPLETQDADSFSVDLSKLGGSTERIDSVTAVNVGLDVVLARKAKNPVTSMMLINDTSDGPKRNQMDLVMARAEAANVASTASDMARRTTLLRCGSSRTTPEARTPLCENVPASRVHRRLSGFHDVGRSHRRQASHRRASGQLLQDPQDCWSARCHHLFLGQRCRH